MKNLTLTSALNHQKIMDLEFDHVKPHQNNMLFLRKPSKAQTNGQNHDFVTPNYSKCLNFRRIKPGPPRPLLLFWREQEIFSTSHFEAF